ncbi:ATPase [Psychrobacter cryohalolentis]|uniref:Polyphosphate:AMP phosphotransferase n=1 Tax=Psychrobacter cryohalolentis (strain ATCC BAA-1226 / DSM 17306 / VKM B-2378 / K5) TaxID=335284 RepID=Q1QCY0_PSYCK|nr:ATPase [Psychrobacter cryohalolentis]ABE74473.1 Polyphosphate:AMP phosphotransferase [Psychrobacter cryohalolentis K5]ASE27097.1 ATPase [Psychrobacter cryohalolentis]
MSKKKNKTDKSAEDVSAPFNEQVVEQRLMPNPLSKFSMDEDALRLALVTAQFALRATRQPESPSTDKAIGLLVLVNGMEQAGKGTAVTQLRQWVDPRLLKVEATIGYCPLAHQPIWQTHTKAMPRHGDVMVYFGNWYADLLYNVMRMASAEHEKSEKNKKNRNVETLPIGQWQDYLRQQLTELQAFEQDLMANQTQLLKCWFHVDIETLQARLNDDEPDPKFLYQIDWHDTTIVAKFNEVAAELLRQQGDWIIIDGADKSQAAIHFCHEVLHAMQKALVNSRGENSAESDQAQDSNNTHNNQIEYQSIKFERVKIPKVLTDIEDSDIDKSDYNDALAKKQARLAELLRARQGQHVVFAFEGMDAAGKGGAIKRLVAPLDPREYQIYNIGAPMLYELQHPYLWRFWQKLPNEQTDRISRVGIFDRTWYGRVLVERIEGFATDDEWQRAYDEINRFEAALAASGTLVIKYWLAIDKKEQLKRFEEREETAYKQFKLTDDDWRNRDKWSDYVQSAADMLARTDTKNAPWCVIANNDKRQARLEVLDHAIEQLSALLAAS